MLIFDLIRKEMDEEWNEKQKCGINFIESISKHAEREWKMCVDYQFSFWPGCWIK